MKKIIAYLFTLALTVFSTSVTAQLRFVEGQDYQVLEDPLPLQQSGQMEVVEFFSYACPHCYNLSAAIHHWMENDKPADVGFYQIPATGGKLWAFTARVKYTADKLGLGKHFDDKYFAAIHKEHRRRLLGDQSAVFELMSQFDVSEVSAEKAWNSLQVKSSLKQSEKLWQKSGLSGVPVVVVNGRYVVNLTTYEHFFSVIDFLLATTKLE
ncbi:MAG: disulfide bond formation protein DsbA [Gammaproteobacteria bacterium]|nr:MAG: disulfide bond formation protein DsbA [Gammaproteobacteria bacterium]